MTLAKRVPTGLSNWPSNNPWAIINDLINNHFQVDRQTFYRGTISPPVNIARDQSGNYEIDVEIPGVDPNTIDLKIDGSTLIISGEKSSNRTIEGHGWLRTERTFGQFARTFTIPDEIDRGNISASYDNGVLTVELPVKPEEAPAKIQISTTPKSLKA